MAKHNNTKENAPAQKIPFQNEHCRLTREWLEQYLDSGTSKHISWCWPDLKFNAFKDGQLTLLNTCKDQTYRLKLQVAHEHLNVTCSCGHKHKTLCEHAFGAISLILLRLGKDYFEKLKPNDAMSLAFTHKKYFDKKESTAGLDVAPRPELKSVFRLAPAVEHVDLSAMLALPGDRAKTSQSAEALAYLILMPWRNIILPAPLPCPGTLNKNRTRIKTWDYFLHKVQQQYKHILTDSQRELNEHCLRLWEMIVNTPGLIIPDKPDKEPSNNLMDIFNAWKKIFLLLQQQPFVYAYKFYGVREFRDRPTKYRARKITLSQNSPGLKFVILDKGAFYQLKLQVWVAGKRLTDYNAGATFFIRHQQVLYRLSSLRDAALAEWIHRSGGGITVFKEHFEQFEREVLTPLMDKYEVEIRHRRTRRG